MSNMDISVSVAAYLPEVIFLHVTLLKAHNAAITYIEK